MEKLNNDVKYERIGYKIIINKIVFTNEPLEETIKGLPFFFGDKTINE